MVKASSSQVFDKGYLPSSSSFLVFLPFFLHSNIIDPSYLIKLKVRIVKININPIRRHFLNKGNMLTIVHLLDRLFNLRLCSLIQQTTWIWIDKDLSNNFTPKPHGPLIDKPFNFPSPPKTHKWFYKAHNPKKLYSPLFASLICFSVYHNTWTDSTI